MRVEMECPECGAYAPPPFAYPRPVYKCDNCGARTPQAELRKRTHMAIVRTDESGGGGYPVTPIFIRKRSSGLGYLTAASTLDDPTQTTTSFATPALSPPGVFGANSGDVLIVLYASILASDKASPPVFTMTGGTVLTAATSDGTNLGQFGGIWYGRVPSGFVDTSPISMTATYPGTPPTSASMQVYILRCGSAISLDRSGTSLGSSTSSSSPLTSALSGSPEVLFVCASLGRARLIGLHTWTGPTGLAGGGTLGTSNFSNDATLADDLRDTTASQLPVQATATESFSLDWVCSIATFRGA